MFFLHRICPYEQYTLRRKGPTAISVFYSYPAYTRMEFFLKSIIFIGLISVTGAKKIPARNRVCTYM